jgi:hypothetical protein
MGALALANPGGTSLAFLNSVVSPETPPTWDSRGQSVNRGSEGKRGRIGTRVGPRLPQRHRLWGRSSHFPARKKPVNRGAGGRSPWLSIQPGSGCSLAAC